MIVKNVKIYTEEKRFREGSIYIEGGRFVSPSGYSGEGTVIDGKGCYAIPGLIDLHFHGCMGADFCDGTREALETIAEYEASVGVTAIAPATMTLPVSELEGILRAAAAYAAEESRRIAETAAGRISEESCHIAETAAGRISVESCHAEETAAGHVLEESCHIAETAVGRISEEGCLNEKPRADLVGINMEGPFISPVKKGAQDAAHIIPCDRAVCERFLQASGGLVKFVGIAPEESEDSLEFIREMRDRAHISLAHTNADYDRADAAFRAGADHVVHLYNAMPPFTHRAPGVVGAAADHAHVWAELICDGVHIHPSAVRAAFRMFGEERIVLISDSMRAAGMPDGIYSLGGLDVQVCGKRAVLVSDGALAGSVTNLMDCMRTAVRTMGIPLETAIACVTINPARRLGIEADYGSISEGKFADLVLLNQELDKVMVIKRGRPV